MRSMIRSLESLPVARSRESGEKATVWTLPPRLLLGGNGWSGFAGFQMKTLPSQVPAATHCPSGGGQAEEIARIIDKFGQRL